MPVRNKTLKNIIACKASDYFDDTLESTFFTFNKLACMPEDRNKAVKSKRKKKKGQQSRPKGNQDTKILLMWLEK